MLIKESLAITGSLSKAGKLSCKSYSLPAQECKTGSKLRNVKGSVCSNCYALKGNYKRFPEVKKALYKRLNSLDNPLWVDSMVNNIGDDKFFRWHDSGDLQSVVHLERIIRVCKKTPNTKHWLPTREYQFLKHFKPEDIPSNLVIRLSAHMINSKAPKGWGLTSTVVTKEKEANCLAYQQGGQCLDCTKCWDKRIKNIAYLEH
jgi:hypothetical protein